jgi:uncharacterized protein (DUF433 family)
VARPFKVCYTANVDLMQRITIDPKVVSGKPCVRGMRVTVANVLRLLAAGHSKERILEAYPYLEKEDVDACLLYASKRVDDDGFLLNAA